jgi:hypothetical protein
LASSLVTADAQSPAKPNREEATEHFVAALSIPYPTHACIELRSLVAAEGRAGMGLRQFLLRGLEKVKIEWRWAATAFNIVKLVRGIGRLRAQFAEMAAAT